MGINVERDCQVLAHLDIELFDAIFTKDTEHTFSGILTRNFNDIVL